MVRILAIAIVASIPVFAGMNAAEGAAGDVGLLLDKVLDAYGGRKALERAAAVRQTGRVVSTMRAGRVGTLLRAFERPDKLRVEISYPGEGSEIRVLDGPTGWRDGKRVSGPPLDAMVLQAARIALPLNLVRNREKLREAASVVQDGKSLRALELPLADGMTLSVGIDPESGRILRSSGRSAGGPMGAIEFVTIYEDFRSVDGVLFPFQEVNIAMGRKTGDTTLEKIEILRAIPAATFRP